MRALGEQSGREVVGVISDAWRGLTPALQASAVELALGRADRHGPLLEKIAAGKVPPDAVGRAKGPSGQLA